MAKGALYLSSGPSGAGKDTLLLGAQQAFAAVAGAAATSYPNDSSSSSSSSSSMGGVGGSAPAPTAEFLQRVITRDPAACTDLEVSKFDV
jgi:ribose 1,5-bisphosphokinase PhnN